MSHAELGKVYEDGALIIRQGEAGDCLYVVQERTLEIVSERDVTTRLGLAGPGELIDAMAVFERQLRSATVRAHGRARVMTIDNEFVGRINEDPSQALRIVQDDVAPHPRTRSELAALKRATAAGPDRAAAVNRSDRCAIAGSTVRARHAGICAATKAAGSARRTEGVARNCHGDY